MSKRERSGEPCCGGPPRWFGKMRLPNLRWRMAQGVAGDVRQLPPRAWWLFTLWIACGLAVLCLFRNNLDGNEAGKLALARQHVDPAWIPGDWYLTTPQPYQWLFQQLAGSIVGWLGFPIGSLLLRLIGYGFWSAALARVAIQLGLTAPLAALAAILFAADQSLIAREWMVGTVEPKTFAYAAALLAFATWREQRWGQSGFWSGLACSFHILVGGYAVVALAGLALFHQKAHWRLQPIRRWSLMALAAGLPMLLPLAEQMRGSAFRPGLAGGGLPLQPGAAWIYVYLRNPHHLVPASWPAEAWLKAAVLLLLFIGAALLCLRAGRCRDFFPKAATADLIVWSLSGALVALVGLVISLVDRGGVLLRLYPFRFADTSLVLAAWLLLMAWIPWARRGRWPAVVLLMVLLIQGLPDLSSVRVGLARQFIDSPERADLYGWLQQVPPASAVVLAPPSGFEDLPLQTGHPIVAQFKQVPTAPAAIRTWYERITALAGNDPLVWQGPGGWPARRRIDRAYERLDARALTRLVQRYQPGVVVTAASLPGPQGWREAFRNAHWSAWLPDGAAAAGHAGAS